MLNTRLFGFWDHLGTALRTGKPQNEAKLHGKPVFEELYAEEARLGTFLDAMSGIQAGNFHALAERFDFSRYDTVTDAGGALALLSRILADKHPHLTFTSFDLPPVEPLARRHVKKADLGDRITVVAGDFLEDELPPADVVTMGNILHDWDLETKKLLIGKAFAARKAVPSSPSKTSSTTRRETAFGLLMSLNMLIEFGDKGFDYMGADFREWCGEAGFTSFELIPLEGPTSAAVAYK